MSDKHVAYAGPPHSFLGKHKLEVSNKYFKEIFVKHLRTYSKVSFDFEDGGIQGWTIDQLYDNSTPFPNKLITTSKFTIELLLAFTVRLKTDGLAAFLPAPVHFYLIGSDTIKPGAKGNSSPLVSPYMP